MQGKHPGGKPQLQEEFLDLNSPHVQRDLEALPWDALNRQWEQVGWSPHRLFLYAVCTEANCPIGWKTCRGKDWQCCYYYDLVRAIVHQAKLDSPNSSDTILLHHPDTKP